MLKNSKLLLMKNDDFSSKKLELIDYPQKKEKENIENWELKGISMIQDSTKTTFMKFNHAAQELKCLKAWM